MQAKVFETLLMSEWKDHSSGLYRFYLDVALASNVDMLISLKLRLRR